MVELKKNKNQIKWTEEKKEARELDISDTQICNR